jgi:hypothetical protein
MGMQIHLRFKQPSLHTLVWLGVSLEVEIQKLVLKNQDQIQWIPEFFASMT